MYWDKDNFFQNISPFFQKRKTVSMRFASEESNKRSMICKCYSLETGNLPKESGSSIYIADKPQENLSFGYVLKWLKIYDVLGSLLFIELT